MKVVREKTSEGLEAIKEFIEKKKGEFLQKPEGEAEEGEEGK
jgi:hypothetical protein